MEKQYEDYFYILYLSSSVSAIIIAFLHSICHEQMEKSDWLINRW